MLAVIIFGTWFFVDVTRCMVLDSIVEKDKFYEVYSPDNIHSPIPFKGRKYTHQKHVKNLAIRNIRGCIALQSVGTKKTRSPHNPFR